MPRTSTSQNWVQNQLQQYGPIDWQAYSPVITCSFNTLTDVSATGLFLQITSSVFFSVSIIITTNGTAGGNLICTLPTDVQVDNRGFFCGNISSPGLLLGSITGYMNSITKKLAISKYDGTYPGGDGVEIDIGGVYETPQS
jgi:hypothetical protein